MKEKQNKINRRNFLKTVGAAGLGSVFASTGAKAEPNEPNMAKTQELQPQMPKRKLGKTGVEVPILSLGTMFDVVENQVILRKALQWGINYWDTAHNYGGGNSELGVGKYLSNNPNVRKDLFIATKASGAETVADVEDRLQTSLKKMNTDYIDLYYGVHGMDDPSRLTDELKQWAEDAKKRKLIRFFGFTTHKNMAECLAAAAELDWIDAIMTTYNFQLMRVKKMQDALDACHKAGIGLVAMKTQANGQGLRAEADKKMAEHFLQQGYTDGQAKLKLILDDKRISCACIGRDNLTHLTLNVAAALDKTQLTKADAEVFEKYAAATCSGYCAGCAEICDSALPETPYVSEVMRYLMYYNSYGVHEEARELFAQIPGDVRNKLLRIDYSSAEARCPQHLPIAKLMAEAVGKLA
ncbi:MAG: aldo/keto reductase [Phycisphaerae bacterium]|nr:aldo/keto reductase [Phycisphaerae bacterium]